MLRFNLLRYRSKPCFPLQTYQLCSGDHASRLVMMSLLPTQAEEQLVASGDGYIFRFCSCSVKDLDPWIWLLGCEKHPSQLSLDAFSAI